MDKFSANIFSDKSYPSIKFKNVSEIERGDSLDPHDSFMVVKNDDNTSLQIIYLSDLAKYFSDVNVSNQWYLPTVSDGMLKFVWSEDVQNAPKPIIIDVSALIPLVSDTTDGRMSSSDKVKLDKLSSGSTVTPDDVKKVLSETIDNDTIIIENGVMKATVGGSDLANKAILETITEAKITNWDNASTNSHTHTNSAVLNKFTEADDGSVLYNEKAVGFEIDDDSTETNKVWSSKKISESIPSKVSILDNDSKYQTESDVNTKLEEYAKKTDIPAVPTTVSELENDSKYLTEYTETDPTVPEWAKQESKPTYTAEEVGALPADTVIPTVDVDKEYVDNQITGVKTWTDGEESLGIKTVLYSDNTLTLYKKPNATVGDNADFTINLPVEQFLDQTKTVFINNFTWSEESYPGSTDPNLDGNPVLVLAVKGDTDINYSFISMNELVKVYKASTNASSITLEIDDATNTISGSANISKDAGNTLRIGTDGGLFIGTTGDGAFQVTVMPDSVAEGTVVQYIGETTEKYHIGYFYKYTKGSDGVLYWEALPTMANTAFQVTSIPDSATEGTIIQYIGNSTDTYTRGYFYRYSKDVLDTMIWEPIDTMKIVVDTSLTDTSTNPPQSKVVYQKFAEYDQRIPTKISQLTNDKEYQTKEEIDDSLLSYATKSDIPKVPTNVSVFNNDAKYQTDADLNSALEPYAKSADLKTKLSQFENDENFIKNTVDNLVNYYLKSELYTQTEIDNLIGGINKLTSEIVTELPTENISTSTIYLIKKENAETYTQYMYIDDAWAELGDTTIDLSKYYTKTEVDTKLVQYALKDAVDNHIADTGIHVSTEDRTKWDKAATDDHTHENKTVLDKFTENASGVLLYNGESVNSSADNIWYGTKEEYDAIELKDPNMLYVIDDEDDTLSSVMIDDTAVSTKKTWSSNKINQELQFIDDESYSSEKKTWSCKKIAQSVVLKSTNTIAIDVGNNRTSTLFEFNLDSLNLTHGMYHYKMAFTGNGNIAYCSEGCIGNYTGSYRISTDYKSSQISDISMSGSTVRVRTSTGCYGASLGIMFTYEWVRS